MREVGTRGASWWTRIEYIAAVREWRGMLGAYLCLPPPLDSRSDKELPAWSGNDPEPMFALHGALNRLVETRH